MSEFEATIDALSRAAAKGSFTPVIGAACSTLGHAGEPRHELPKEIQRKAQTIAASLDEEHRRHLNELIDLDPSLGDPLHIEPALLHFYVALVKLDRCVSIAFRNAAPHAWEESSERRQLLWRRHPGSILSFPRSSADWHVPLVPSEQYDELQDRLVDTVDAADAIERSEYASALRAQGLGVPGILVNLRSLESHLFKQEPALREGSSLPLKVLVWIGDLLWHALRFDLSYYPTSAELAFQLSLQSVYTAAVMGPTPTLAQAAENVRDVTSLLSAWFTAYSKPRDKSGFYRTIARFLIESHKRYVTVTGRRFRRYPFPMALTTNYDQELENAIAEAGSSYAVVIPVFVQTAPLKRVGRMHRWAIWLMKAVSQSGHRTTLWSQAGYPPNSHRSDPEHLFLDDIPGPLIVKLHGSPMEVLPSGHDSVRGLPTHVVESIMSGLWSVSFAHRIVISESDYLRDMREGLPYWLHDTLQDARRSLFFLGHSIGDWNLRLRIADSWAHDSSADSYKRFAVNLATGFDRAFMSSLGIAQVVSDLELVQHALTRLLESGDYGC